jgi:hypothetical protein
MPSTSRWTATVVTSIVVLIATLGYVLGHGSGVSVETTREASTAFGSLDYSSASGWRPAPRAAAVPGLAITTQRVLAPKGDGARAGLVAGRLGAGGAALLPAALLARMRQPPTVEVVYLSNTQAYKYTQLKLSGVTDALAIYVIPTAANSETAILCYSTPSLLNDLKACEQIATTWVAASGAVYDLTPDPSYAHEIRAAVERVDGFRSAFRRGVNAQSIGRSARDLATRLAEGLGGVVESLSAVQPPPVAGAAQTALLESLQQVQSAYEALAVAAGNGNSLGYVAARLQIYQAEARVDAALGAFALLGYE